MRRSAIQLPSSFFRIEDRVPFVEPLLDTVLGLTPVSELSTAGSVKLASAAFCTAVEGTPPSSAAVADGSGYPRGPLAPCGPLMLTDGRERGPLGPPTPGGLRSPPRIMRICELVPMVDLDLSATEERALSAAANGERDEGPRERPGGGGIAGAIMPRGSLRDGDAVIDDTIDVSGLWSPVVSVIIILSLLSVT